MVAVIWNGTSFIYELPVRLIASEASGHFSCGDSVIFVPWDSLMAELPITVKELFSILIVGILWGHTCNATTVHGDLSAVLTENDSGGV